MKKLALILVAVFALMGAQRLFDKGPDADQLARSGFQLPVLVEDIDATETKCLPASTSTTSCAVFPYDSRTVVVGSGNLTCVWSANNNSMAIGAQGATTGVVGTTSQGTGNAPGYSLRANAAHDFGLSHTNLALTSHLVNTRYCNTAVTSPFGTSVYPPCDTDADCAALGAGGGATCNTAANSPDVDKLSGAMLYCRPEANSTLVYATPEN